MVLAVADASVVAKWFLEEPFSEPARQLRDDFFEGILELRAPSLLPFEVLNALRFHPTFPRRDLREAGRALDRAGLALVALDGPYLEQALETSVRDELTVYDAAYVALAEIERCMLYTADDQILHSRRRAAFIAHIRDYPAAQ